MKKLLFLLSFSVLAFAQKRPVTHEDIWLMKRISDPVASPDGRSIVFSMHEPDYDAAKQSEDLWVALTDGSVPPRRLTFTKAPETGVAWSPDGTRIAFVTKREEDIVAQVYVLPMNGGEAQRITHVHSAAANPKWRPDGNAILFESEFDPIAAARKERKSTARVYDAMPVRFWNAWLDERKPHIFVQELREGAHALDVLKGSKLAESAGFAGLFTAAGRQTLHAVWAPDGNAIVFAANVNRNEMMTAEGESDLFVVPAAGGEPRQLTPKGQRYSKPRFSPKGDALFAVQERRAVPSGRLYSLTRLVRFPWPEAASSGAMPVVMTEGWDRSVTGFAISHDGQTVYIEAEDDGFDQLFKTPAQAAPGSPVERLFKVERGGYSDVIPVAGGLVAMFQTAIQPPEIVRLNVEAGTHSMLTGFNADKVAQLDAPPPVHFWFAAKNGKRIHNILFLPPQFDPNKRYPLVVFPHGGPNSMSKDGFSTRWNSYLLASPGYVVLETNYTGSTGFGEKFADDIEKDVLRGPAEEILEAIVEAVHRYPYIDEHRQAAAGASYGGYLMNWFNGHTNQFKCIVNHAGAINNESQYGVNDGGWDRELRMGGAIWEKNGQWNDQSPIRYSGSFNTPTLITDGELDYRVPISESMTTFKILQRRKVPSRLVIFPDEGHWILKGENSRKHMEEVLAWLQRYL